MRRYAGTLGDFADQKDDLTKWPRADLKVTAEGQLDPKFPATYIMHKYNELKALCAPVWKKMNASGNWKDTGTYAACVLHNHRLPCACSIVASFLCVCASLVWRSVWLTPLVGPSITYHPCFLSDCSPDRPSQFGTAHRI